MKHTIRAAILSVLIILSLTLCLLRRSLNTPTELPAEPVIANSAKFMLRMENDEIVIYKNGTSTNTGIEISGLRKEDRTLLENGIHADSYEEVLKLIEDFAS